ncbi:MAG: hypothetical protein QOJ82_2329, partial [Solirubrobacteraceae bacterium]|nr:hypothetical protein [Solirubrobacteraceae bacterium]
MASVDETAVREREEARVQEPPPGGDI